MQKRILPKTSFVLSICCAYHDNVGIPQAEKLLAKLLPRHILGIIHFIFKYKYYYAWVRNT